MNKIKQLFSTRNFKHGSYSVGISVVVIAIVIVVNLILGQLPQSWTNLDMSSTKIYTTGEVTQEVVDALEYDVEIHIIAQEANIDSRIKQFVEHLQIYHPDFHTISLIRLYIHPFSRRMKSVKTVLLWNVRKREKQQALHLAILLPMIR